MGRGGKKEGGGRRDAREVNAKMSIILTERAFS